MAKEVTIDAAPSFTLGTDDSVRIFVSTGRELQHIQNEIVVSGI